MDRKRKKKPLCPRCKRMKRSARLQSARTWLKQYSGKNVLQGYCKHYGVDWRCAALELRQLGIRIDSTYLKQREVTAKQLSESRKQRCKKMATGNVSERWYQYSTPLEAYLAEDYPALHDMERKEGQF